MGLQKCHHAIDVNDMKHSYNPIAPFIYLKEKEPHFFTFQKADSILVPSTQTHCRHE